MEKKELKNKIKAERNKINTNPTEKQKKAGNYKMGHIRINGFDITIENPKGSYRKGIDSKGKKWKTYMHNDYGYFTKTKGKDGDHIDVFIGNNPLSSRIYVVDQRVGGSFDESKVMLGFNDKNAAKEAYLSNYESDWKGFWKITETNMTVFKKWLYDGYRQRKPFFDYKEIKERRSVNETTIPINQKEIEKEMDAKRIKELLGWTDQDDEIIKRDEKLDDYAKDFFGPVNVVVSKKIYNDKESAIEDANNLIKRPIDLFWAIKSIEFIDLIIIDRFTANGESISIYEDLTDNSFVLINNNKTNELKNAEQ